MSEQVQIPEDLADCYRLQKQALRCFRNDEDQVAIARRTMNHIERIAALQRECDALRAERTRTWEAITNVCSVERINAISAMVLAATRESLAPKPAQEAQS